MSVEGEKEAAAASVDAESIESAEKVEKEADTDSGKQSEDDAKPRKDGTQRRIDRLTREKYQLRAELDLLKRQAGGAETQKSGVTRGQYESDEDYVEALVNQRIAEREAEEQARKTAKKVDKVMAEAEKLGSFDREDFYSEVPVTTIMAEAILDSDIPAQILVYLNDNPEEAERIADLPKARQAAAIGKLEVRLTESEKPKQAPKKSAAPEPVKPIAANKSATGYRQGMSLAEYGKLRGSRFYS